MTVEQRLRVRPAIVIAALMLVVWLVPPFVHPEGPMISLAGGMIAALAILVWWTVFSRAAALERTAVLLVMLACLFLTWRFVHPSIATGMMGALLPAFALPAMSLALALSAVATAGRPAWLRRLTMVTAIALACAAFTLVRTAGVGGGRIADFHWRWTATPEERLIAREGAAPPLPREATIPPSDVDAAPQPGTASAIPPSASNAEGSEAAPVVTQTANALPQWPGFRGPRRDGAVPGVRINTDWTTAPPLVVWRRPVGPGWSSFAVDGQRLFTQEQRGEDELVSAYDVRTGAPLWRHRDRTRFWESNGGAGPRATPTLSGGRLYTFGATGILNVLDARNGSRIWSRDVRADLNADVPTWGFSSSPLVIDGVVIVAAGGQLAAYDADGGARRWSGAAGGFSYSSPHRAVIGGVEQILFLGGDVATGVNPADGAVLWRHAWAGGAIVQPALTGDGDVLVHSLAATGGNGIRRLAVGKDPAGSWSVEERWTSNGLKPYFSDFVVHAGHAYGVDGSILACIDLADGTRKWKGGRYGAGQVLLLPEQDLLLVLSDQGELALVSATPGGFMEVARIPALDGKTWNHPVVAGDLLLLRNDQEMAAFSLPLEARTSGVTPPVISARAGRP